MAKMTWAPDIRQRIVRTGWDAWVLQHWAALDVVVRSEIPVLTGYLRGTYASRMQSGGVHGTKKLVFETRARYSAYVHGGRGPVQARPGGILTWLTAVSGGRLAQASDGTRVMFERVGPAAADPYLVRGLELYGLTVEGFNIRPGADGIAKNAGGGPSRIVGWTTTSGELPFRRFLR